MSSAHPRRAGGRSRGARVRARRPARRSRRGGSGAETEFIPVETATWRRCPLEGDGCVRHCCRFSAGTAAGKGGPRRGPPRGRRASRCPAAGRSPSSRAASSSTARRPAARRARCWPLLRGRWCCRSAPRPRAKGSRCWPWASIRRTRSKRAPLLLPTKRYERMADYLGRRGPAGARMMRQTAAFQVALDLDDEPWLRWRVLNAAAPYVVAIFANSSVYAGEETGCASARAQVWRALDPARTGLPWDERAPGRGLSRLCARGAGDPAPTVDGEHLRFGEWLGRADVTLEEWHDHLTTLFPEVRPRGHFELRSADAVAPQWYAAPLALAVGITYDPGRSAPPPTCSGRPTSACSTARGAWGCATPRWRRPRRTWRRSPRRLRGARPGLLSSGGSGAGPGVLRPLHASRPLPRRRAPVGRGGGLAPSPPARRSGSDRPRTPSTPS